jgi:hypothetical protein
MQPANSNKLRRLSALRPIDLLQMVVLSATLLEIEFRLQTSTVPRTAERFGVAFLPGTEHHVSDGVVRHTAEQGRWLRNAHRVLKRWPFDRSCLRRSIMFGWILRDHNPGVVLGVRHHDGAIAAHAWLRIGDVDLDSDAGRFERFT